MRAYVAARLATAVLVIVGVSLVSFLLTFLTGDPAGGKFAPTML